MIKRGNGYLQPLKNWGVETFYFKRGDNVKRVLSALLSASLVL